MVSAKNFKYVSPVLRGVIYCMFTFFNNAFSALMQLGSRVASLVYAGLVLVFTPVVRLVMRAVRGGNRALATVVFVAKRFGYVAKRFGYKRALRLGAYRLEQKLLAVGPSLKKGVLRFAPMALVVVILAVAIPSWSDFTLAYEVNYDGNNVGYVTSEAVVADAYQLVKERVVEDDFNAKNVTYSLTVIAQDSVNDANEISDNIISVSEEIETAMGLYVDGNLITVCRDAAMIEQAVSGVVSEYSQKTGKEAVSFANDIEYIGGVYPAHLIQETVSSEELRKGLTVMKTATKTYTEEIPFEVKEVSDSSRYIGYRRVVQEGVNGKKQLTADVSYVNGKEVSRVVTNQVVTKEPVAQTVVVGAKPYSKASNTDTGTTLFWPVAQTPHNYISAYYGDGRNHKATIDLCAPNGTPIYAAEDGEVTYVGWESGYGYYCIIEHAGGLSTLYSHCSTIAVTKGQKVSRGDHIAAVGITGRASAYHLHFEIRVNGVAIDGRAYLGLD